MFRDHHVLPKKFANHPVIRLLGNRFNIDGARNLVTLPSRRPLATELNSSPHTGGHLKSYYKGFYEYLERIRVSTKFNAAAAGDARARDDIASDVNAFVAAAKYAVASGYLLPNTPEGRTKEESNNKNSRWFPNGGNHPADISEKIRQMQETVDQFDNAGRRDAALAFPILSPTSDLSMAERIEILKRFPKGSPISLQFTAVDPVPAPPRLVPSLIDTRLRGLSPPAHPDQNVEGFTRNDPRFNGELPAFPAPGPDEKQFDQLPPTTAASIDPLVLRSDPASGAWLPFYENPLAGGSFVGQNPVPLLAGAAAAGVALPFVPGWLLAFGSLFALSKAATAQDSMPATKFGADTPGGGVFSTGTTASDTLGSGLKETDHSSGYSNSATSGSQVNRASSLVPEAHASSFADRFGNWTSTPSGTVPTEGPPEAVPTPSAGSVPPEEVRRLARVNASNAGSVFTSGSASVPYLPSTELKERFGSWIVPTADGRPPPASKPIGAFADEPSYLIPPPIFGVEGTSNPRNDAEEWFSRWIRPFIHPE